MLLPSTYLRHFYNKEDDWNQLRDVHTHSTFEQFHPRIYPKPKVWNRKENFYFGNKNFQACVFIERKCFYNRIVLWPGIIASLIITLVITSNTISTAVVSEMLISALDLLALPLSMLTYCCSLLSAADFSIMSFCFSLLPALLSMVSFSCEWEVWAASLVLQFCTPPLVLTVLLPWFEIPPLVLIVLP